MTTTHTASVSVLQVGDSSVWSEGFVGDQEGRVPFGLGVGLGKRVSGLDNIVRVVSFQTYTNS